VSKSDSQKKDSFKAKPATSPAVLLSYLNSVLDDIERLEGSRRFNPYVDKYIRTELATAYHETKNAVSKIRAQNPAIKETPADSNEPREYLRNVHSWCVGQLFWENGERIGETPAEKGRNTAPAKRGMFKRIIGWIFKKTWHLIVAIIVAIIGSFIAAILIDIFGDFGWIERIKAFIYNILQLE